MSRAGASAEAATLMDEATLIQRVQGGEKSLFHDLIRPYERAVYVVAFSALRNQADAEEVAQETFLKALANLHQLRDTASFKGWLLHIALNEARMRRRKNHPHLYEALEEESQESEDGEMMPRQFADWRENPAELLERKEIREAVQQALQSLPELYRQVFVLRDVEHLDVAETAAILGISHPAVKTRLHRARLMLREQLSPAFRRRWTDRLSLLKGRKPW